MSFDYRNKHGKEAENLFRQWLPMQAGWHICPYGQGLIPEDARQMMRNTPFNGDSSLVEELLASLRPKERRIYMDRIHVIPNLTRWMPDFVIAFRNEIVCAPDVKTSLSKTPNWSVEMSSIFGNKIHAKTGVQCIFAFPPSDCFNYWTCASPDMLRERCSDIHDGRNVRSGSGTPYYLVPKRAVDISLKRVMTDIELNGKFEIPSTLGTVVL